MRKRIPRKTKVSDAVEYYGADIIYSDNFKSSHKNMQHGDVSVMEHSISVSMMSVKLAKLTHLKYDYYSLVRGSLLHDYFLYDWHEKDSNHKLHGFRHADRALTNAANDFSINPIEANMIMRHMFPLNIRPPKTREAIILCIADKICAAKETVSRPFYNKSIKKITKK